MEALLHEFLRLFTDLRGTLQDWITVYQLWTYAILFVIVFCETGLVVTPFLPGDSLLFAAGALTVATAANADGSIAYVMDPWMLVGVLSAAAILGDTSNYLIGRIIGPKVFHSDSSRFLNKRHLERTHRFYEKHGGKTIILARFVPIIRTFAPFVAGIGKMSYTRFISFNVIGGIAWPLIGVFAGVFFGEIDFVKKHFEAVVVMIVLISLLPILVEYLRHRRESQATA
jgi:membrane-associated protein